MIFLATKHRCVFNASSLSKETPLEKIHQVMDKLGFRKIKVDIVKIAREQIDQTKYKCRARMYEAPNAFDCSSFTKWLYSLRGITIPRLSIQQRAYGNKINLYQVVAGDLIFTDGPKGYYKCKSNNKVGHVGLATGFDTVIHASHKNKTVIEESIDDFLKSNAHRGCRRIIPLRQKWETFLFPPELEIESSDDIRWLILSKL